MPDHLTAVDFSRSSCTWLLREQPSYGSFALDALLSVRDEQFVLAAQVFAGDVYGDGPLFREPPYAFSAAFSRTHYRMFRDAAHGAPLEDTVGLVSSRFSGLSVDLQRARCRSLPVEELVAAAPPPGRRLSARLRVAAAQAQPAIEMEFPLRHLNVNPARRRFQAETGPLLALETGSQPPPERLRRAYAIFSRLDRAELLLDAPRPAPPGERWRRRVALPCAIELLAIEA